MPMKISRSELRREFTEKIREISGQRIYRCFQCGMCSGCCPMVNHMGASPRKMMRLAQLELVERLKKLKIGWVCSSCQNCGVICPRGIDLPKVLEALRLMTLRKNENYIEPSENSMKAIGESPTIAMVALFRKLSS